MPHEVGCGVDERKRSVEDQKILVTKDLRFSMAPDQPGIDADERGVKRLPVKLDTQAVTSNLLHHWVLSRPCTQAHVQWSPVSVLVAQFREQRCCRPHVFAMNQQVVVREPTLTDLFAYPPHQRQSLEDHSLDAGLHEGSVNTQQFALQRKVVRRDRRPSSYRSAIHRYVFSIPSSNPTLASNPILSLALDTSSRLRGCPFGFVASQTMRPS